MAVKRDITDPLIFAAIFAFLLGYRVVKSRRRALAEAARDQSVPPAPSRATA
jgi:DMSO/TMAO reductase YedYZ heme-binding membrane subunit